MDRDNSPYVVACGFCEQGLLRFAQCEKCGIIVALCDECDLIWSDIVKVKDNPSISSSATFPACPGCRSENGDWIRLQDDQIKLAELDALVAGNSN